MREESSVHSIGPSRVCTVECVLLLGPCVFYLGVDAESGTGNGARARTCGWSADRGVARDP